MLVLKLCMLMSCLQDLVTKHKATITKEAFVEACRTGVVKMVEILFDAVDKEVLNGSDAETPTRWKTEGWLSTSIAQKAISDYRNQKKHKEKDSEYYELGKYLQQHYGEKYIFFVFNNYLRT